MTATVTRATGRILLLLAALVGSSLWVADLAGADPDDPAGGVLTVSGGDPGELVWAASPDGEPVGLELSDGDAIGWDLTGLDPDRYRSDLVRFRVESVEGPGRFSATAPSPFGTEQPLVQPPGSDEFVLQLGRRGDLRWRFDTPGIYLIELIATVPETPAGVATGRVAFEVTVDGADPSRTTGTTSGPASTSTTAGPGSTPSSTTGPISTTPSSTTRPAGTGTGTTATTSTPGTTARPATTAPPGGAATAPAGGDRVVIADGHVDMGPRFVDGSWRVQLRDDRSSPAVWRDLADVVLQVGSGAVIEVPEGDAYTFLGSPGDQVHVLPQVQEPGLVWPGWNTQDPSVISGVPGGVTWRLRGVDGPGRFLLYLTGSFGASSVLFDSDLGFPQDLAIGRNTHVHGNWAFGAVGTYELAVEMRATSSDGRALSDTRVLTVQVGEGGSGPGAGSGQGGSGVGDGAGGSGGATPGEEPADGWAFPDGEALTGDGTGDGDPSGLRSLTEGGDPSDPSSPQAADGSGSGGRSRLWPLLVAAGAALVAGGAVGLIWRHRMTGRDAVPVPADDDRPVGPAGDVTVGDVASEATATQPTGTPASRGVDSHEIQTCS